jgi:hypothetical protein
MVGLRLNFTFLWPFGGHQVLSNIYLVDAKCLPLST